MDRVVQFFSDNFMMPHGYCFLWLPEITWLHVASDLLIAIAYFSIPMMLYYFSNKRPDLPFRNLFLLFALFITMCGITHVMNIVVLWHPYYGIQGLFKLATGVVSAATAVVIFRNMPQVLKVPSPKELQEMNEELRNVNSVIEKTVERRTTELEYQNWLLETQAKELSQMKSDLEESQQFLQRIMDQIPDLVFVKNDQLELVNSNKAFNDFVKRRHLQKLVSGSGQSIPSEYAEIFSREEDALANGEIEFRAITQDEVQGTVVYDTRKIGFKSKDGKKYVLGICHDVTEQEQVNRIKDQFISTVNHELRTPLTSIQGSLDILQATCADMLNERGKRMLEISANNTVRLITIVNDILDMEKIAAGQMEYHIEPCEIVALVADAMEQQRGYTEKYNVHFDMQTLVDEVYCNVDASRLNQALINLIANAVKFSPEGETVTCTVEMQSKRRVRISVADNGAGIRKEFQDKIFDKFAQSDSPYHRSASGTGLGLNITCSIVEAFKGKVGFNSEEGKGSTFYIVLPICAKPKK